MYDEIQMKELLIKRQKENNSKEKSVLYSTQKSIWVTQKLNPKSSLFNVGGYNTYYGRIDIGIFTKAFEKIINEQDIFCLKFFEENGEVYQKVSERKEYKIFYCEQLNSDEEVMKYIGRDMEEPISLDEQLFKTIIFKVSDNKYYAFFKVHHIISDGYSISILVNRLIDLYVTLENKSESEFKLEHSYFDLIKDEMEYKLSERCKKDEKFWMEKLNVERHLAFESCRNNGNNKNEGINRLSVKLNKEIFEEIVQFNKKNNTSVFDYLIAAIYITNRMYNNDSFILGLPVLGRNVSEAKKIMGAYITMMPFFLNDREYKNIIELIKAAKKNLVNCYRHMKYSMFDLSEKIKQNGLLYNISFSYQRTKYPDKMGDIKTTTTYTNQGDQQEDLVIHLVENLDKPDDDVIIYFDYKRNLFREDIISEILNRFANLLKELYKYPDKLLSDYVTVTDEEQNKILDVFNNTKVEFPNEKCIHDFFEEKAEEMPDNVAVKFKDKSLKYKELDCIADKLAVYLQKNGIGTNNLVGICMERSIEMVIAILAIYKAGGAYVPIDPEYPEERLKYMIADSKISIMLTQSKFINILDYKDIEIIELDNKLKIIEQEKREELIRKVKSDNWAYMIYTSGSTGRPKGVINIHKALVNRIVWMQNNLQIGEHDVILQKTPFSFDVSVWEFVWPLMMGATIVMAEPGGHRNPEYLAEIIKKEEVTTIHFVPSMLRIFVDEPKSKECTSLKRIICSGEELKVDLKDKCLKNFDASIYNLYGPTEAAIDVSYWKCDEDSDLKIVPIGRPIDNIELYILNKDLKMLPVGVAGELYISGVGLSVGYYDKEELTKERFINNPYSKQGYKRMYKTGDLARWLPDGNIEYLGRVDFQVKINGLRIELGEIEYQLSILPEIKEAKVIDCIDKRGNKCLIAYCTKESEFVYEIKQLKKLLKEKMPAYMVPSAFIYMEQLPLTPNGKLDRKALPEISDILEEREYVEAVTEEEKLLVELFKEILGIKQIGIKDDFFELGGTSLKGIQLVSKYKAITIQDLYNYPTIEEIMKYVHTRKQVDSGCIVPLKENKNSSRSIVCIPYGGGVPIIYKDLADKMPDDFSVYSISLSGHDYTASKDDLKSLEEMAKIITEDIIKYVQGRIILYGHCVGCALTYEVARQLNKREKNIERVFMAASFPFFSKNIRGKLSRKLIKYYYLKDDRTLKFIKKIGGLEEDINPETVSKVLTWFRHDGNEAMRYFEEIQNKNIDYKIKNMSVITGTNDPITKYFTNEVWRWSEFAENTRYLIMKGATHYFVKNRVDELSNILISEIN